MSKLKLFLASFLLTFSLSGFAYTHLTQDGCDFYAAVGMQASQEGKGIPKGQTTKDLKELKVPEELMPVFNQVINEGKVSKLNAEDLFYKLQKECYAVRGEVKKLLLPNV